MNFAELAQFKTLSSNEPLITDFESMAMENRKAICKHVKTESYWKHVPPRASKVYNHPRSGFPTQTLLSDSP